MSLNCNPPENEVYCRMFRILLETSSKPIFSVIMRKLKDHFNCPDTEDNEEEYENFEKQADTVFKIFTSSDLKFAPKLKRCIRSIYGDPVNKSKQDLFSILKKVFRKVSDDQLQDFIDNSSLKFTSAPSRISREELPRIPIPSSDIKEDEPSFTMIEEAIDSNNLDVLKPVPTDDIKRYINEKLDLQLGTKNYTKEQLFGIIKNKALPSSPRPSPRVQRIELDKSVEDEFTCNLRKFNKEQIASYLENVLGKRLSKKWNYILKPTLCKMIQERLDEMKREQEEKEEDRGEQKYEREEEETPVTKKTQKVKKLKPKKPTKSCGDYENINNADDFFVCDDPNEVCDVDNQKCISLDEEISPYYRKISITQDNKSQKFYGTANKLRALRAKYNRVKEPEDLEEDEEEQKEIEEIKRRRAQLKAEKKKLQEKEEKARQDLLEQQRKLEELRKQQEEEEEEIQRAIKAKEERKRRKREEKQREREEQERQKEKEREEKEREEELRKQREREEREEELRKQKEKEERKRQKELEKQREKEEEERQKKEKEEELRKQKEQEERKRQKELEKQREKEELRKQKEQEELKRQKELDKQREKEDEERQEELRKQKEQEDKKKKLVPKKLTTPIVFQRSEEDKKKQLERERMEKQEEQKRKDALARASKSEEEDEEDDFLASLEPQTVKKSGGISGLISQFMKAQEEKKEKEQGELSDEEVDEIASSVEAELIRDQEEKEEKEKAEKIKAMEEREKQRQKEKEAEIKASLEEPEEEIEEVIPPSAVSYEEVRNTLKNRLQDPAYSRILGNKSYMNIAKQVSYCVGLSS